MRKATVKPWREYLQKLTQEQRDKLLYVILEHELDYLGSNSFYHYREASLPEYPDEPASEECIYWESCGESLLK